MAELFADLPAGARELGGDRAPLRVRVLARQEPAAGFPHARRRIHRGLPARAVARGPGAAPREPLSGRSASAARRAPRYLERLEFEAKTIIQMGFAGYFLIVADFINWAKTHGVPVGPGRGSGAGSLVAYSLGITDLDPLRYDLLFERFLNPERVSMPDFDIDFCQDGRDRVIDYVKEKYGAESVSQIATFGTMAAKAVVRDVGRVLSMPYGEVDRIAKLDALRARHHAREGARGRAAVEAAHERAGGGARADGARAGARGPRAQRRHARGRRAHRARQAHRLHAALLRRGLRRRW